MELATIDRRTPRSQRVLMCEGGTQRFGGINGVGQAIFSTWIGFVWFGSQFTSRGWCGLGLSTLGGVVYSVAKFRESRAKTE